MFDVRDPITQEVVSVVEPGSEEEHELRGLWLSRRMFGWMVGMSETRDYEEWLAALGMRLG